MKRVHSLITILLLLAFIASPALSQPANPWSFEFRTGVGLPTQDLGDLDLNTGYGFELTFGYQLTSEFGLYAGWDWYHFGVDGPAAVNPDDFNVEDTGYAFGVRVSPPFLPELAPWLLVAGVFDHVEFEADDLASTKGSDHTLGWEAGAGLTWPLSRTLALTPGVRYRSFSSDFELMGTEDSAHLSYVSVELGLRARF